MADISKVRKTTLRAIEDVEYVGEKRPYLGMSQLGHSCIRYLWYSFRWCFDDVTSARMQRLFQRGHKEEDAVIATLESAGLRCYCIQDEAIAIHGHCMGHNDGKVKGVIEAPKTPHILEIKTMNNNNFKEMQKTGVKRSKPVYYAQCQLYMHLFNETRALFVAVNKNDDSMYIERVKLDSDTVKTLLRRGESVILSEFPPKKPFESTWYECRYCSARMICHGSEKALKNCRTCAHIDLLPKGEWSCSAEDSKLTYEEQLDGCIHNFKYIQGL